MGKKSALIMIGLALGGLLSCTSYEEVEHPEGEAAWEQALSRSLAEEEVVARVGDREISLREMELAWKENPQWERKEVLEYLVERELLVAEAIREGYLDRPEVAFGRKQGMVAALLREEVEEKARIDASKEDRLREAMQQRRRIPAGIRASHLVVLVPQEIPGEDGETRQVSGEEREELQVQSRRYIEEAIVLLEGRSNDDALREVSARLNEEVLSEPFEAVVNEHLLFPRIFEQFAPDQLPPGWTPVAREFAEGAETVASKAKRGTLSEPVKSQFGWHLIRVESVLEPALVEAEAGERYVQEQLRLDGEITRLGEAVDEWFQGAQREVFPERLERGQVQESF